ncbi:TPA: hypothetical protein ACKPYW_002795 [Pseudomonas aeruginosa]|uniref:hypothetical protein n=1 Tax=Pseudomonas aeruginosa TaxID=287 RepID=UPI00044C3F1C|nr:hypothetical protein [Pseudomonas aeruginosa]KAJ17046.1 hypothetical protein M003_30195 [Pseudomonas aeruginosa IGB83]
MAVYEFKNGQFQRLAESLDDFDGTFRAWEGEVSEFAAQRGMLFHDDVDGVYDLYLRDPGGKVFSRLRDYRWWFRVYDGAFMTDDVLVPDSLPDYLAFMALLQPVVARAEAVAREVREATR